MDLFKLTIGYMTWGFSYNAPNQTAKITEKTEKRAYRRNAKIAKHTGNGQAHPTLTSRATPKKPRQQRQQRATAEV